MNKQGTALVTGASSGIGEAFATVGSVDRPLSERIKKYNATLETSLC